MIKEYLNICIFIVVVYLLLALALFLFQRNFLYYPESFKPSGKLLAENNLKFWPSSKNYRGFIAKGGSENTKGTVIVFHGNAGTAYHRIFYINALSQYGFRVILAEYPGYGGREGQPSESVLVNDALETIKLAYQTYGEPLYLWGESLGSGVVSGAIAKVDVPINGLTLFTPWDSLPNLAQTHYWYLPARWLVLDQFNSVENLRQFKGKVAVILAERDEVIPVKHGKELYKSINTRKKVWSFEDAGHNSVPIAARELWWKEVSDFLTQ
ncbi:alpha/beta hydrolase [Zooshikella sp. RANM57]|uniref:alpha/beta hydrolase n=1 Tax=Zooshikella sp. RANM57 TaxID=3425863 RepID=UPI003D6E94FA